MSERGGELVAANEPAVVAKTLLDAIVMEDGQGNGCLADSTSTDESKWSEGFSQADYLLDQVVSSKKRPRWWWR